MPGPAVGRLPRAVHVPAAALAQVRDGLRRNRLARRLLRRRVVAVVAAVAVGAAVASTVAGADRTRARWGPTRPVVVTRRVVPTGTLLGPDDVTVRAWPVSLLPDRAVVRVDGRRTARHLAAGVPLTEPDLAPAGRGPVAARLAPGRVGVTVGRGTAPAPVRPDDLVDVVGLAATSDHSLSGRTVARRAVVVAVDDRTVTVSVRTSEAPTVAAAGATGTVALVLLP